MNPKIKELWDKAADPESDDSWESQTEFMERFAELIVRECVAYLKETDFDDIVCSNNTVVEIAADYLQEHFGVE